MHHHRWWHPGRGALRIEIPQQHRQTIAIGFAGQVDGRRALADGAGKALLRLVGRTRGYNGEGNAAPRRRSSIDAGLARPNQLGESLSQLVQAADDAEGVPY